MTFLREHVTSNDFKNLAVARERQLHISNYQGKECSTYWNGCVIIPRPQQAKILDIARCYLQMNKPNAEDLVHKEATVNERKQFALNYYMVENVQVRRTDISIFSNDPLQLKGTLIIMKLLQSTQTFCYFRSLSYHFHCKKRGTHYLS